MEIQGGRRLWTKEEKRRMVEETLKTGVSVAAVAREHAVNANQLHWWRQLYRKGLLSEETRNALLPVKIVGGLPERHQNKAASAAVVAGAIDIDLGHARVRIEGAADPACVRAALEGLRR
jgi:transposase